METLEENLKEFNLRKRQRILEAVDRYLNIASWEVSDKWGTKQIFDMLHKNLRSVGGIEKK